MTKCILRNPIDFSLQEMAWHPEKNQTWRWKPFLLVTFIEVSMLSLIQENKVPKRRQRPKLFYNDGKYVS